MPRYEEPCSSDPCISLCADQGDGLRLSAAQPTLHVRAARVTNWGFGLRNVHRTVFSIT